MMEKHQQLIWQMQQKLTMSGAAVLRILALIELESDQCQARVEAHRTMGKSRMATVEKDAPVGIRPNLGGKFHAQAMLVV